MNQQNKWRRVAARTASYLLVAVVAAGVTAGLFRWNEWKNQYKLQRLEDVIDRCYIGDVDRTAIEDAAAEAMVEAIGNRWSYYIPASAFDAHMDSMENSYVGVGITISAREDGKGMDIVAVEPTGGAAAAGILPGDTLIRVEDQTMEDLGTDGAQILIRGEEGTYVSVTVLRGEETLDFQVERRHIQVTVASGEMLDGGIGYVEITNFNARCAEETIAAVESLVEQGAKALIFDVRFNPGGFKDELVKVLDYLLPEGELFRSVDYTGAEEVDTSDASCLKMPMAVLINGDSYSAAEFFAAALWEYDWAVLVGTPTVGKSHFQYTIELGDGSAVNLSVGKYYTPKGVSLADEGGLKPALNVEVDEETYGAIYAGTLTPEEDPQLQAAIKALTEGNKS